LVFQSTTDGAVGLLEDGVDAAADDLAGEDQGEGRLDGEGPALAEASAPEGVDEGGEVGLALDTGVGATAELVGVDEELLPGGAEVVLDPGVEAGAEAGRR
jgi:hypothetical protein